jgi:hypothetical protein
MSEQKRTRILAQLARYTGKHVPAAFVYRTADFIPEIERFQTLSQEYINQRGQHTHFLLL